MQEVSGRLERPSVHFQTPPRAGVEEHLEAFLAWFENSRTMPASTPCCVPASPISG